MKFLPILSFLCLFLTANMFAQGVQNIAFDSYDNNLLIDEVVVEFPCTPDDLKVLIKSDYRTSGRIAYFDNTGIYAVTDEQNRVIEISIQFSPASGRATTTGNYKGVFKFDKTKLGEQTTEKELRSAVRASHFPFDLKYNTVVNIKNGDKDMVFIVTPDAYLDSFLLRHNYDK